MVFGETISYKNNIGLPRRSVVDKSGSGKMFLSAIVAASVMVLDAAPANAVWADTGLVKPANASAKIYRVSQAMHSRQFNIPPQHLSSALVALARQTGLQVSFSPALLKGRLTKGVRGKMTARQALGRLLKGSGLETQRVGELGVVVRPPNRVVAQEGGAVFLPEIFVTGEKEDKTVFETKSSVGVVTSDDIENSTMLNTNDVIRRTANVNPVSGGEGLAIRGVRNGGPAGGGTFMNSPVITTYIDGAPLSPFGLRVGPQALWDVKQVEVLRGAQSIKQGRNSLAGAVHIKSKDPVFTNESAFRVGGATQRTGLASIMANGVIVDDLIAVRIAVDGFKTDGFNNNPTLGISDQAEKSEYSIRGKLRFDPKILGGMTNVLTASYTKNHSGDDVVDANDPFARSLYGNVQGFEDFDQTIIALDSVLKLNDNWSIKNFVNFNRGDYDRHDDFNPTLDASNHEFTGFPGLNAGLNDIGNREQRTRTDIADTFTEELRLHYSDKRLKASGGAYYANIQTKDDRLFKGGLDTIGLGVPAGLIPLAYPHRIVLDSVQNFDKKETNWALFAEATYDLTDMFTVFGGLRYDRVNKKARYLSVTTTADPLPNPLAFPSPPFPGFLAPTIAFINNGFLTSDALIPSAGTPSSDDDAWLPTAGVTLNFTEDFAVTGLAKRGYRAGGTELGQLSGVSFTYNPEFTWTYEMALRSRWMDNRLSVNANIFYTDWTDQQISLRRTVGLFTENFVTNAASSELYGFELDLRANPVDALNLFVNVGYVKTRFKDLPLSGGGNLRGNEFTNAPNWTLAGGAQYDFSNGMYVQGDANYTNASYSNPSNTRKIDARTVVNAKIGYKMGGLDISGYVTNLFDEEYTTVNATGLGATATGPGRQSYKLGDGRSVGLRLTAKIN